MPHRWTPSIQNVVIWIMAILIVLSTIVLFIFPESWQQKYTRESNYYSIQVLDYGDKASDATRSSSMKVLVLDHLIHSYVVLEDPTFFQYDYLKIFSGLLKYSTKENSGPAVLHLGGGGYSFPKYIEVTYPGSLNDVIEIDPAVTQVAYQELGLPRETRIITYNQDARIFLHNQITKGKYDFVIGDVFNDLTTPYHLTTLEFDKLVKASMKDSGIYLVNIIDSYKNGKYMPAFINTLKHAFKYVYLLSSLADYESTLGSTFVIAATDRCIDLDDFISFISKSEEYSGRIYAPDEIKLENYLADRNAILLTDDYAPTDILVAPLFRLRGERR
jgi:spermidine synthase